MSIPPPGYQKIFIFDLDGTLALTDHRNHLLKGGDPDKWRKFYAECHHDAPNQLMIAHARECANNGIVWIWSGRSKEVFNKTVDWLMRYAIPFDRLKMREEGDWTKGHDLKEKWLNELPEEDRKCIRYAVEDDPKCVDMYERNRVRCFLVRYGGEKY